jgi:hypothetical protein
MWHTMGFVAESRRLDVQALEAFALARQDTYGIVTDRGATQVNTWHVDALVADFKAASVGADATVPEKR